MASTRLFKRTAYLPLKVSPVIHTHFLLFLRIACEEDNSWIPTFSTHCAPSSPWYPLPCAYSYLWSRISVSFSFPCQQLSSARLLAVSSRSLLRSRPLAIYRIRHQNTRPPTFTSGWKSCGSGILPQTPPTSLFVLVPVFSLSLGRIFWAIGCGIFITLLFFLSSSLFSVIIYMLVIRFLLLSSSFSTILFCFRFSALHYFLLKWL